MFTPQPAENTHAESDPSQQLAMVIAEAPAFPATASQLTSLNDLPIPQAEGFSSLVALQPRMDRVRGRQTQQAMQISDLRKRSGSLLLRWHEIVILAQGRCWAEWDTRMRKADRLVRREDFRTLQENDGV